MIPMEPLWNFTNATIDRTGRGAVLFDVNWMVQPGESWAIVGPSAAGKSTFAETLCGKHRTSAGQVVLPTGQVRLVGFSEESRQFRYAGHYYQQRFEFADTDTPLSLLEYLTKHPTIEPERATTIAGQLGIVGQLELSFMKLSNGQTRRARIAKGLLAKPELLILDDPFLGLDVGGRSELQELLGTIVKAGQGVLLICRPDDCPAWVSHVLLLDAGRIVSAGRRAEILSRSSEKSVPTDSAVSVERDTEAVIVLNNVCVAHGGRTILDDVSWTVRRGERWALVGPNGAGKTTLLSLICGDHPQAFANEVLLFGKQRGSGETVWDIKRRFGFVSPEFQLYFQEKLTGFEAASTGFHDVVLYREATAAQAEVVRELFARFGAEGLMARRFRQLATSEQRLVLLVRALVKRPPLLILDEPFLGLDGVQANQIREYLETELDESQTLIVVTHRHEELPRSVRFQLELCAGRVARQTRIRWEA